MPNCKVCALCPIIHGKDFCEACRTFLKRHRNRTDFQCEKGDGRCFEEGTCSNGTTKVGTIWRSLCKACRLEKCKQIREEANMALEVGNESFEDDVTPPEEIVNVIMKAKLRLGSGFAGLVHKNNVAGQENCGSFGSYRSFVDNIEDVLMILKSFASGFQFFTNLTPTDRAHLFQNNQLKVINGFDVLSNDDFYVAGYSREVMMRGMTAMPEYIQPVLEQCEKTWHRVQNMSMTPVESAFFLALLFSYGKVFKIVSFFIHFKFVFFSCNFR